MTTPSQSTRSNLDSQSILVVGGCGNFGHRLVAQLLQITFTSKISILDSNTSRNRHDHPNTKYFTGDISLRSSIHPILLSIRPSIIFHAASPVSRSADMNLYLRVNLTGTKNILAEAKGLGCVKAFIYTSSSSVTHNGEEEFVGMDERLPYVFHPHQMEVYSHSKAVAEEAVLASNSTQLDRGGGGMLTVSLRPGMIFGENDTISIKPMIEAAKAGQFKVQFGDGRNLFDFVYVENLVHAHVLAAEALLREFDAHQNQDRDGDGDGDEDVDAYGDGDGDGKRVNGEAFLITNDEPFPFWEFCRGVGEAAGYPTSKSSVWVIPKWFTATVLMLTGWVLWIFTFGTMKTTRTIIALKYSMMTRTYCIDKIKERLGYRPLVGMREAIRRSGESFKSSRGKLE